MLVRVRERFPVANTVGLEGEIDRIFRGAFGFNWGAPAARRGVKVTPDADGVTVRAELPGIEPADIAVTVENRILTISAEHKTESTDANSAVQSQRTFYHAFQLANDLDGDAISADARNGVLTLRIPKREAAKPRQIEVKTS